MGRFILLLLAGCGFSADQGNINSDFAGVDFAGADLSILPGADLSLPPGADLSGGCNTCNCGQSVLLMAIESVNGGTGNDGRILQFGLGGAQPARCGKDLVVGKTLEKSPKSLSWFPPDSVLYGGETTLYLIDAGKDLYRWNFKTQRSDVPIAAFPIMHNGAQLVGAGFDTDGFNEITDVYIIDPKNGMQLNMWDVTDQTNSPIFLGSSIPAMTQSPLDPEHIFYLKTIINDAPAEDVAAPFDGNMVKPTVYWQQSPTGAYLSTIESIVAGGLKRTVWVQHSQNSATGDGIYFANDDGSGPTMTGPLSCNHPSCAVPFKTNSAAPDPTAPNRVFATCSGTMSDLGHVVRIDDSGTCDLIFDGNTLPTLTYPSLLTIAAPR